MADLPPLPAGATPSQAPPPPLPPGATLASHPDAPPLPAGAQPSSGFLSQLVQAPIKGAEEIIKGVTARGAQSFQDLKGDATSPIKGRKGGEPNVLDHLARIGKTSMDLVNVPFNLTAGVGDATLGRESEKLGGPKKEVVGDAAAMLSPFGGEFKKLGQMAAEKIGSRLAKPAEKVAAKGEFTGVQKPAGSLDKPAETVGKEGNSPPSLPKGAIPTEGPLKDAPALTQPRKFEDQLFQLDSNRVADKTEIMNRIKSAPDLPAETWEKMYHHEEDPKGVKLTPEEQAHYDEHVAPLAKEGAQLSRDLEGYGYKLDEGEETGGHTPRYPVAKTRSFGEVLSQWKEGVESKFQGGAAAKSMRTTADAQKSRRFYNAVSPDGEKIVVHVGKDGKVSAFDGSDDPAGPDFGQFKKGQKLAPGAKLKAEGQTWRLEDATTKEIEAVAKTRYHKNVFANRLDNVAKLRSAVRNAKFIENMKASPEWSGVAAKVSDHPLGPPEFNGKPGKTSKVPQFQGYYLAPHVADALDDAAGARHDLDGISTALDKVGNIVKGSLFWNPLAHMKNEGSHYLFDKGLVGGARDLATGSTYRSLTRAARAVRTQNEDLVRALRSGASLPYSRFITRDLHKTLTAKLGETASTNPTQWEKLSKAAGYANPIEMVKALYKTSNKALWLTGDTFRVARYLERMEKGLPMDKAIKATEEHMPNYRVPSKVMGTRFMAQMLKSPAISMFGPYQYNRLANYLNVMKDIVSKDKTIGDKAAAMDKIAMLGTMLFLWRPFMDKVWQEATGNENAKTASPGVEAVPRAVMDVAKGERTLKQGASSVFSPGILEAPVELLDSGRYTWSGQPIAYPENLTDGHPDQFARDIGTWMASKVSPVGQAQRMVEGGQSVQQFMLGQLGVQTPTDQQVANKNKYANKDAKYAAKRAVKKSNQRGQ